MGQDLGLPVRDARRAGTPALRVAQLSPGNPIRTMRHIGTYADNGVPWAAVPDGARITGHATSNPIQKTDPGSEVMAWLAARGFE